MLKITLQGGNFNSGKILIFKFIAIITLKQKIIYKKNNIYILYSILCKSINYKELEDSEVFKYFLVSK